nr:hypothetical protein [Pandoravirus massiliensis]
MMIGTSDTPTRQKKQSLFVDCPFPALLAHFHKKIKEKGKNGQRTKARARCTAIQEKKGEAKKESATGCPFWFLFFFEKRKENGRRALQTVERRRERKSPKKGSAVSQRGGACHSHFLPLELRRQK